MKIFVSYARLNETRIVGLVEHFEKLGHKAWFDRDLSGGRAWWDEILRQVRECDVFVYALTPESVDSVACKRECSYALALRKAILPIVITEGISTNLLPVPVAKIQLVDYTVVDLDAGLRLARAVANFQPSEPLADPLPEPPEIPISYLGSLRERIEAATLTGLEQSSLVIELKGQLREPQYRRDARSLLEIFRRRHDLLATVADEIDETLATDAPRAELPAGTLVPPRVVPDDSEPAVVRIDEIASRRRRLREERMLGALIVASIACVLLMAYVALGEYPLPLEFAVAVVVAYGVLGALSGMDRSLILATLGGGLLGWLVLSMVIGGSFGILMGGFAGAPAGGFIGLLFGFLQRRRADKLARL